MKATTKWLRETIEKEMAERQPADLPEPKYNPDEFKQVLVEQIEEFLSEAVEDEGERQGHQARLTQVFEVQAALVIKDTVKIDDVYTEIRAIDGVTIVSTAVEKRASGVSREKSLIKIKFLKGRSSLKHYVSLLTRSILRVNGVVNVKLLTARKLTA
jgi:hypothetical protein